MAEGTSAETLFYKKSTFVTHLPKGYRYLGSHSWLASGDARVWRVGLTKFATRMLGEMVDQGFETAAGAEVVPGQILGWVEGFKAISDIYCAGRGRFLGVNPAVRTQAVLIGKDPYRSGWLYEFEGEPDGTPMDAVEYAALLDKTIERILQKQKEDPGGG